MIEPLLLCSDLDRTILPNGTAEESPAARRRLRALAEHEEVTLAYVTGRHLQLIEEAIAEYALPMPAYAIGDVGTTLYERRADDWHPSPTWEAEISTDWNGARAADLAERFEDLHELRMQEPQKQNHFKLSYYTAESVDHERLLATMRGRLDEGRVKASLIWSVDEAEHVGLIDVLPERATKLHAVRFLMGHLQTPEHRVVFAGDSGNDLPALTSGLQAVLVANAQEAVRREAVEAAERNGASDRLYLARGDFLGMNGNYTAGVLEGLVHYLPEVRGWLEAD